MAIIISNGTEGVLSTLVANGTGTVSTIVANGSERVKVDILTFVQFAVTLSVCVSVIHCCVLWLCLCVCLWYTAASVGSSHQSITALMLSCLHLVVSIIVSAYFTESYTDLCPCGETQTMSHIVESCPLTKLNGGLSRLHSADDDAVSWLTNYGKWHAYEKKKKKWTTLRCH